MDEIYLAEYNNCIYEGQFTTISVHKSEDMANIAMMTHKENRANYFKDLYSDIEDEIERNKEIYDFMKTEDWRVRKVKLEE